MDGVRDGRVALNEGKTILDLKPGYAVTLARIRRVIKSNGFVTKEATMLARGSTAGERRFAVSGTNEQVELSAPPKRVEDAWQLAVPAPR